MSVYRELETSLKLYSLSIIRIWLLHMSKPRCREYSIKDAGLECMLKVQISVTHGRGLVTLYGFSTDRGLKE